MRHSSSDHLPKPSRLDPFLHSLMRTSMTVFTCPWTTRCPWIGPSAQYIHIYTTGSIIPTRRIIQINSWPCQRLLPHQVRICLICDLYMWVCHFVFNTIWSITSSRDFLWYLLYWVNNCGNYFYFILFYIFYYFFELQQIGYE